MDASRRGFLVGLGAVLAASTGPIPAAFTKMHAVTPRIPVFSIRTPISSRFYYNDLIGYLHDLFEQVQDFNPTADENYFVIEALEDALWHVKPPGILIQFNVTMEEMINKEFFVYEDYKHPGTAFINNKTFQRQLYGEKYT